MQRTGVRVLITAADFGRTDYLAGLGQLGDALAGVHTVAVVGAGSRCLLYTSRCV